MTHPLATAFVLIRPTTTGFGPTLKREMEGQAGAAGAAGRKTGQSWTKGFQASGVTKVAGKITEGLAGAGVASVVLAAKFQTSMTRLTTQAGVGQRKIKGLSDGILNLAGQVGFSPDSLAASLYHVESNFESMGITSKKALSLVKIAAEGAAVGGANLTDVTNALTAAVASGIPGVSNFSKAMGTLNTIVGVGDMSMQDLADAFGTGVLASVKGFGLSIKDVGAALAVFGDNNIRGAVAGSQLRMAVMALAAPTAKGVTALGALGIKTGQLARDMQKGGLKLALEDLVKHMRGAGISAKEQGQIITTAFGKKAGVGLSILAGQMDRLLSKYPKLSVGAKVFGVAVAKVQKTAGQQMKELAAGFEAVAIKIGDKLLPPVMSVFNFIRTHTGLVLTLAGVIGGLAVTVTAVSAAIKLAVVAQELWTAAMWLFDAATSANPIGATIILIGALVVGIVLLWKHAGWFRTAIGAVWKALKITFNAVWGAMKAVYNWLKANWPYVAGFLLGPIALAAAVIWKNWRSIWNGIKAVWGWLKTAWNAVYGYISTPIKKAVAFIWTIWQTELRDVAKVITAIRNFFAPAVTWLVNAGKKLIGGLFSGVWSAMKSVGSWIAKVGTAIIGAVKSFFGIHSPSSVFFGLGTHLMTGLFKGMVHGAGGLAKWVVSQIKSIGGSILGDLLNLLGLGGGPSGSPGKATGTFQKYAASILPSFGWSPREIGPLISLWNRESGWNPNAQNPTSTAYGIAQFLDSTWAPYGAKTASGYKQVFYGEEYIRDRYGDPAAAWGHEQRFGWYDTGGWLPPGLSLAYNGTGRHEQVIPHGGRGGGPQHLVVSVERRGADKFMTWIQEAVRIKGGDPAMFQRKVAFR